MTKAERKRVMIVDVLTIHDHSVEQKDMMEVFSTPHITATAKKVPLRADHAFDIKIGCDLRSEEAKQQVRDIINQKTPRLVTVCQPCGPYSTLQRLRKVKGEACYVAKREAEGFLRFAMEICHTQHIHTIASFSLSILGSLSLGSKNAWRKSNAWKTFKQSEWTSACLE